MAGELDAETIVFAPRMYGRAGSDG